MINFSNQRALIIINTLFIFFNLQGENTFKEFKNIGIEEGLPHYTINDILQDSEGYIWIASDDGLVKYNSYKYKVFKYQPDCETGIQGQQILSLHEDSHNNLWVGTNKSLNLFNKETEEVKTYFFFNKNKNFTEKIPVTKISEYNDSTFLIGTDGGGLYVFHPTNNNYIQCKNIVNTSESNYLRISDIVVDDNNNIWITSLNQGLLSFDLKTKRLTRTNTAPLDISEIRSIVNLGHHKLLLGSYGEGLWEYDSKTGSAKRFHHLTKNLNKKIKRIYTLKYNTKKRTIYIGTDGEGLIKHQLNNKETTQFSHQGYNPNSIANNAIRSILIDNENNLWLGHYKGGISFSVNYKPFYNKNYNPIQSNSLSHQMVNCMIKDDKQNILIGTDGGGINILKPDGSILNELTKNHPLTNHFKNKTILALYKDHLNNIWVGTYLDGVYIIHAETQNITHFNQIHKLTNNDIRCFFEDREGKIWIGTNGGGINVYDPTNDSLTYIIRNEQNSENSISLNWISCISSDSYGFIWIGTAYGLNKYDPVSDTFTKYYHQSKDDKSISNDFIFGIFEDSKNQLWIGTSCGLNKYNRTENNFSTFYTQDGLPNNIIYDITEGADKNLWISTNNGLSNYNKKQGIFYNYNVNDGILSESFINGAIYKSNDSIIYLGSIKGLTYFNPCEIKKSNTIGSLILTDFKIFNKSVKIGKNKNNLLTKHISKTDHILLSPKENYITFEFTFMNYSNGGNIQYEYMLENFDQDWIITDKKQRNANYTNLEAGDYIFKVRTINTTEPRSINLPLTIKPSFIKSIWFKILATLIVGVLSLFWDKMKILKIESQKALMEKELLENKLKYEKEQTELKNKNLRCEMENKNAQLTSTTLLISHKNDIMKEIKNKLIEFANKNKLPDLDDELKKMIMEINKEFKVEQDWNRFEEHFNQIHKDFFHKLKSEFVDLSPTYLKLSAYLKMNLTSKEIASLMNISVRGVEKARSRLKQKLQLPEGERLITYICNL